MRIQQLIKELMELERIHGDILVEFEDYDHTNAIYWPITQTQLSVDKTVVILK